MKKTILSLMLLTSISSYASQETTCKVYVNGDNTSELESVLYEQGLDIVRDQRDANLSVTINKDSEFVKSKRDFHSGGFLGFGSYTMKSIYKPLLEATVVTSQNVSVLVKNYKGSATGDLDNSYSKLEKKFSKDFKKILKKLASRECQ